MPNRAEITPRDFKEFLPHVAIFERTATYPSSYVIRLVGTGLTRIAGHVSGKALAECVPPDLLPRWIESFDLILDASMPLRFLGRVQLNGHEYLDAEHLYVPLANDAGLPTYLMGLFRYTPRHSGQDESWQNQIASIPADLL